MNVRKRGLALLMCICMIFTLLPFSALADSTGNGNGEAGTGEPAGAPVTEPPAPPTVEDGHAKIGDQDYNSLDAALAAAKDGDTIYLGEGVYSVYGSTTINDKGLTLTFVGSGRDKTTWNIGTGDTDTHSQGNADFGFRGNESLTFKNMTLRAGVQKNGTQVAWDYVGFAHTNYTKVDNCDINGKTAYWGYKTAEFKDCTFNCPESDYALWYYTGNEMTFDKCTFNASGKIINVYREGHGSVTIPDKNYGDSAENPIVLNYKDCTVNSTKPNKSVLNIKDTGDYGKIFYYEVNITGDNTVLGLNADSTTCSRLFQVTGDTATVTINGVTVWKDGGMVDAAAYHKDGVTVSGVSYDDGNANANDSLYTDGYKDNAVSKNTEWVGNKLYATYKCEYCDWTDKEVVQQKWDIPVSKTATELKKDAKGDYKTNVTLSVPGVEESLATDVVFVLDESDCKPAVLEKMTSMLSDLKTEAAASNASINVGIIFFRGIAVTAYPLTKYTGDNTPIIEAIGQANSEMVLKGTNLPAGLNAAQKMLSESRTSPTRQYMILVSDGATYLYTHDNDPTTHYSRTSGYMNNDGSLYEWYSKYGANQPSSEYPFPASFKNNGNASDWNTLLTWVEENRSNFIQYDQVYTRTVEQPKPNLVKPDPIYSADNINYFVTNTEESMYQSVTAYKQIVASGVNCYTIPVSNLGVFKTFADYLADLGKGSGMNFGDIKDDILYAVAKGSYVKDVIGDKFTLDQDNSLNVGICKIKEDGTKEVTYLKSYKTDPDADGNWTQYFGDSDAATVLMEHYRFMVAYDAASKTLTWTFNEKVSNFAPVQLSYTLELTKPETKPGTYGKLDLDGSNYDKDAKYPNVLYTNEYAKLYPKCSNGIDGTPTDFPMPSVEYTVRNPYRPPVNPGIGDEIIVEITGNSDSVVYDGTEHSVKDYTVKISDPRYTEADFTFTGKAEASGVNAGTYEMGLKAEQFKNTNARFTNVKFVIKADGVLTITPKELTITAGSKTEYGPTPVTCDEWTVSGLAAGDKVESVKITGIQSVPGSSPNVPSDAVIKNAKGEDVTKNYAIKYVNGTLTMLEVLNKEDHFNYIIGTPEGLSLPTANVTRAEVATIFFRLMTDDARAKFDSLDNNFSDVAKGQWYNRAISTLANAGIIKGDPAGTYRPGDPITRAEMATIIARFGDFKEGGKTFNDISGHWAQKYIELAASNGWINGNPDGTFKPNNNITRAETVAMINRVLDRQTKDVSDLLPVSQMTNWSDNMDTAKWYYRDMQEATNNHKAERVGNSEYEKWTEKLPDIDWASYQI